MSLAAPVIAPSRLPTGTDRTRRVTWWPSLCRNVGGVITGLEFCSTAPQGSAKVADSAFAFLFFFCEKVPARMSRDILTKIAGLRTGTCDNSTNEPSVKSGASLGKGARRFAECIKGRGVKLLHQNLEFTRL
jgi:hypothetical protein